MVTPSSSGSIQGSSHLAPGGSVPMSIRLFHPSETHLVPYLAAIHANCVTADHAIVTFLPPIDQMRLLQFWKDAIAEVRDGERMMLLLFDESEPRSETEGLRLMGVITLKTPRSETGPFRGWVEKLLVSPKFRRRGGGKALMLRLEEEAAKIGRTLLMADTETNSPAERLLRSIDYVELGRIPDYSNKPFDGLADEVFFYKRIG